MKCFYDPSKDAVGTCKSCGRGISFEHLTEMDKGLACKNRCEADTRDVTALIDHNIKSSLATSQILKKGSNTGYGSAVFTTLMGCIFTFSGIKNHTDTSLYLGIAFLVYGLWSFFRVYKYATIVAKIPESNE
jgi:hypothetical protein